LNIDLNNTYTRQLVQTFHENATSGFDYGLESKSNNPLSNDANWLQQNIGLTSQASVFNENLVLPLKLNLSTNSLVRFRVVAIENIASNQPIFLYDALTGVYYNLTTTMPEISLVAGIYQNRFDIRFTSSALSNNTNLEATNSFLVTYQKNNEEIVLLNHEKLYINSLDLIDLSGKLIFSNKINSNSGQFKIPVDNIAKGVYIANIKSTNLVSKIKLIIY